MSSSHAHPTSLPSRYAILSSLSSRSFPHEINESDDDTLPKPRPRNPVMGEYPRVDHPRPSEVTPLLLNSQPSVASIEEQVDKDASNDHESMLVMVREEFVTLVNYSFPVFLSVFSYQYHLSPLQDSNIDFSSSILEYSLVIASVISIGHISTIALAGITLGSMTASVTGFSVLQGLASALDTLLPPAWTSSEPRLVGLWTQRMGKCNRLSFRCIAF